MTRIQLVGRSSLPASGDPRFDRRRASVSGQAGEQASERGSGLTMTAAAAITDFTVRCREVLRLWLRWNLASQQVIELMFAERSNPEKVQQMLDDLEPLRVEAASASQELLDS